MSKRACVGGPGSGIVTTFGLNEGHPEKQPRLASPAKGETMVTLQDGHKAHAFWPNQTEAPMSKPMTISEAVNVLRVWASACANPPCELLEAEKVLRDKRLCDESEAREVLMDLIRQHAKVASDPSYLGVFQLAHVHGMPYTGPEFDLSAARRWLAEHGGE